MLKRLILVATFLAASATMAQVPPVPPTPPPPNMDFPVSGQGRAQGDCKREQGATCIRQLKRDAEFQGIGSTHNQCHMRGGRFVYGISCSSRCNPNAVAPDKEVTKVVCTANCFGTCQD